MSKTKQQCDIVSVDENRITFAVDDVKPACNLLWTESVEECLGRRAGVSILEMPDRSVPVVAPPGYAQRAFKRGDSKRRSFVHPLVEAVHMAFSEHRPLILSPDTIWLTVVQGFGQHILNHAEQLRGRIVKHAGQAPICLMTGTPINWPDVVAQFSAAIKDHSDPILHETLLCDFSTTTPEIRTAYQVALMEAYRRYFKYELECICGIPQITLEGTTEDWRRMRERIEVLATYGLDWWTSRLSPIMEQFAATASGVPDRAFWQAIYKPQETYFREYVTGWIADLFPYLGLQSKETRTKLSEEGDSDEQLLKYQQEAEDNWLAGIRYPREMDNGLTGSDYAWIRNHILESPRVDWLQSPSRQGGIAKESFPSGLSRAPLTLKFLNGLRAQIELMAGFFGVSQRPVDNALSPIITWAAVEAANPSRETGES